MELRCATFNVLADSYKEWGDYGYVDPALMVDGARTEGLLRIISELQTDVIALQEVELPLRDAIDDTGEWQSFWTPKQSDDPDGCLMLVRRGIEIADYRERGYDDQLGYVMQALKIGRVVLANTHLKWAPADDFAHVGVRQAQQLLREVGPRQPAVLMGDFNDRPGGPVRQLLQREGFVNIVGDEPTSYVDRAVASLDVLAVRNVEATRVETKFSPVGIPNALCPSDHVPIVATIQTR